MCTIASLWDFKTYFCSFWGHRVKFRLGGDPMCIFCGHRQSSIRRFLLFSFQGISGKSNHEVCPRKLFLCGHNTSVYIFSLRESLISCSICTNCPEKVFLPSFLKRWHCENVLKQWCNCERLSRAEGFEVLFKNAVHLRI